MKNNLIKKNGLNLQIDGDITGLQSRIDFSTLENSNEISSDAIFRNLKVAGRIFVRDSLNGTNWLDFDDLLLNGDGNAIITGAKTFLGDVQIRGDLNVKSRMVNGHFVDEFVTTDTEQEFPS